MTENCANVTFNTISELSIEGTMGFEKDWMKYKQPVILQDKDMINKNGFTRPKIFKKEEKSDNIQLLR